MIKNWFKKNPEKKNYKGMKIDSNKESSARSKMEIAEAEKRANAYQIKEGDSKQDQIDGLLDNLGGHLDKLKIQAHDIGNELDDHNQMLEQLDDKLDTVNDGVTKQSNQL